MNYDGLEASYWNAQIERVEQLRRKIADRAEVASGRVIPDDADLAIGSGRRLNATVLFTDISGFSGRASATQAEQEMMLRVLNLFFTEMIRIIEDYGGAVEKNTGDGLMAYFEDRGLNDPGANSVKRAIACALTMDATNELLIAPVLRASGVEPLKFRTTMDWGAITVARIGAAQRFNANVAIGNTANFASRMLSLVGPGDIALGGNAKGKVPIDWQMAWCELSPVVTGWSYIGSSLPYPLYLYRGRWARLI
jgi:class 3 adenylate cyclase